MCVKRCKLTRTKQLRLLRYFVSGLVARTAAELAEMHRNTVVQFFYQLRTKITYKQQDRREQVVVKLSSDKIYFWGARKGEWGRGASGKIAVLGIFKSSEKVYTQIVLDAKTDILMPIIRKNKSW